MPTAVVWWVIVTPSGGIAGAGSSSDPNAPLDARSGFPSNYILHTFTSSKAQDGFIAELRRALVPPGTPAGTQTASTGIGTKHVVIGIAAAVGLYFLLK